MAISYANVQNPKDNFTFKCHRSNGVTNGFQDIYAVNDIAFHPVHGKKTHFDIVRGTVAINELLCMKNAGAQIAMDFK